MKKKSIKKQPMPMEKFMKTGKASKGKKLKNSRYTQ
jgi:hypothetical protein